MLGLRTVIYPVPDLAAATEWYARAFGTDPYFQEPYYVGFAIHGYELGLVPDGQPGATGSTAYWGTDDLAAELSRIVGLGATVQAPLRDVGDNIKVAIVLDPFGNAIGLIENPHFDPARAG
jgi:predicted enzyme related to lactoylglutathione lyase